MMKMENKNVVYKITNNKNEKVYIGITTDSINRRKSDQISKAKNGYSGKLYNAIATYGAECFKWEQIDTASTKDELAQKEKDYILKYNSKEKGYNSDKGGGVNKKIYSYGLGGEYIQTYSSLSLAAMDLGLTKKAISKVCNSTTNRFLKGFLSYDKFERFISNDKRTKKVYQYTFDGIYIKSYGSVAEASRASGVNKSSIAKACRRERISAGKFLWTYFHYGEDLTKVKLFFGNSLFRLDKNQIRYVGTFTNKEAFNKYLKLDNL